MLLHSGGPTTRVSLRLDFAIFLKTSGAIGKNIFDRTLALKAPLWISQNSTSPASDVSLTHRNGNRRNIAQGFLYRVYSQAIRVVHNTRIHLIIRWHQANVTIVPPVGGPSRNQSPLLDYVVDKEVSMRINIRRQPVTKGRDRPHRGRGRDADGTRIDRA